MVPKIKAQFFVCKIKQAGTCKIKAGGSNNAQPQQRVANRSATEGADRERSSEDRILFSQTRRAQIERRISFSYSFFYINQSSAQSAKVSIYTTSPNQEASINNQKARPYFNTVTKIP